MSPLALRVVSLESRHDRSRFQSGSLLLDQYFKKQVSQDVRRRVSTCFVAVTADDQIAGFYTLSAGSVPLVSLPTDLARKLPLYPRVPVARMGRLAVDANFQHRGVGGSLLVDALTRTLRSEIAVFALVVDAKDDAVASFYIHHGLIQLRDSPLQLFLPLSEFERHAISSSNSS